MSFSKVDTAIAPNVSGKTPIAQRLWCKTIEMAVLLFLSMASLHGQLVTVPENVNSTQDSTKIDSTDLTGKAPRNGFFSIFHGKPGKAAFYSLIIPAGGQIYNKRWWKVPLALGIHGSAIYLIDRNRNKFKEFDAIYFQVLGGDFSNIYGINDPERARIIRNTFRQDLEYSWAFLIVGHLITVFDAFVDRHLIEFDISDDLSIHLKPFIPNLAGPNIPIGLSVGIPFVSKSSKKYDLSLP